VAICAWDLLLLYQSNYGEVEGLLGVTQVVVIPLLGLVLAFLRPVAWGFAAVWALGLEIITIGVSAGALSAWHFKQARSAMLVTALIVTVVVPVAARLGSRRAARRGQ
jgi:hypothetical protein